MKNSASSSTAVFESDKVIAAEKFDLSAYRGKKVILHFWSPFCFVCKPEMQQLSRMNYLFERDNYQVIGIGTKDSMERIKASIEDVGVSYLQVIDNNTLLAKKYAVDELPSSLFFNEQGLPMKVFDPKTNLHSTRFPGMRDWDATALRWSLFGK